MSEGLNDNPDRIAGFQSEIESMKVKAAGGKNESKLLALGILLLVGGVALAVYGGIMVHGDGWGLNFYYARHHTAVDRNLWFQLLQNLIENAISHGRSDVEVDLDAAGLTVRVFETTYHGPGGGGTKGGGRISVVSSLVAS